MRTKLSISPNSIFGTNWYRCIVAASVHWQSIWESLFRLLRLFFFTLFECSFLPFRPRSHVHFKLLHWKLRTGNLWRVTWQDCVTNRGEALRIICFWSQKEHFASYAQFIDCFSYQYFVDSRLIKLKGANLAWVHYWMTVWAVLLMAVQQRWCQHPN